MQSGILVCGLNGVGKSTLGRALAAKLDYYFLDNEDLYFPKNEADYSYAVQRTRQEAEQLLLEHITEHPNFVFATVMGPHGIDIINYIKCAVLVHVPRDMRLQRVRARSYQRFGPRMLAGGDLYEREQAFFDFVSSRPEDAVETWIKTVHIPVIYVDGTLPIESNTDYIIGKLSHLEQSVL